jgi:hypothetical protein
MKPLKTHFEQIPVELVKQIANRDVSNGRSLATTRHTHKHHSRQEEAMQDGHLRYPKWERAYQQALLELEDEKLKELIAAAEKAIFERLRVIECDSNHNDERHSIGDALSVLNLLKRNSQRS